MTDLIEPYLTYIKAAGYSARTIESRAELLRRADRELPYGLDNASTAELAAWLAAPNWAGWTRHTYFSHLNGFYAWACRGAEPYLSWNPTEDLIHPSAPDSCPNPVTHEEYRLAYSRSGTMWRRAIVLAAYAGLRATEIAVLQRADVTEHEIRVRHGKGDKPALLPNHPAIWAQLRDVPPGHVLLRPRGTPYDGRHLPTVARVHFDRIGLPGVHLHRFRHLFGTLLLEAGVHVRVVQTLMRHRSLATTAGYLEVAGEQRRLAVQALPTLTVAQQAAA